MIEKDKTIIKAKTGWLDIDIKELLQYKDLIILLVKRNFTALYKQTILGPLWFVLNPLLTTVIFTIVFGNIAGISTDGIPQFVFYLTGYSIWLYFSNCLTEVSNTFVNNSAILGKVYFPRLAMPISTVLFSLINFVVVFAIAIIAAVIYWAMGANIAPNICVFLIPIFVIQTAVLGLGMGIIISSLTTKYRDLSILVTFGVQLWMYITPVVYPLTQMSEKWQHVLLLNPMASIVNNLRYALLGCGNAEWGYWFVSIAETMVVLFVGVILFNHVEKSFMDTV